MRRIARRLREIFLKAIETNRKTPVRGEFSPFWQIGQPSSPQESTKPKPLEETVHSNPLRGPEGDV